jgi:DNA-binding XRE family transcriptional regulator
MLELTRRPGTDDTAEICLRVPARDLNRFFEATRSFLLLAGHPVQEVGEDGEPLYSLEEVFPETHPGMVLRGYRTREDMTQKALAAKIGISASNLSDMEHGRRPIGKEMAKRLGEALNLDYRLFL